MDADTVEACLFAADDERGKIRQGPTDGNSESYADTCHYTTPPEQLDLQSYSTSISGVRDAMECLLVALADVLSLAFDVGFVG